MLAALVLSAPAGADSTPATTDGKTLVFHQHRARAVIQHAYSLERWQDPTPAKLDEKRAWKAHRLAILIPKVRYSISFYRDRMARRFERYRERRLFTEQWTPYYFGEPTISHVAIPPYIVRCETNGFYGAARWGAHNPSGSNSLYQMMPSTYGAYCVSCDWSHADQHIAARKLYLDQGSAPWACA